MYDENLHNIRIYFTNSHVYVLLYAYNCVIITYNLPGVKDISKKKDCLVHNLMSGIARPNK